MKLLKKKLILIKLINQKSAKFVITTVSAEVLNLIQKFVIGVVIASNKCMLCHYWYFKDIRLKFEPHVFNECHDVMMTAYELKNIGILNVKEVNFRYIFMGYW